MPPRPIRGSRFCQIGKGVKVGRGSEIAGGRVVVGPQTRIGSNVSIRADEVRIGSRCEIEDGVQVYWRKGVPHRFVLGDCCTVGSGCKIYVRELTCGDYVALHNHVLVNGDSVCSIGHNSYVGQNVILNANRPVTVGKGVGIVAYSAIWTHGKFGELIEGSTIHKEAPVVIEDDVTMWRAIVSPGVRIGRRATILNGSVITRDVPEGTIVAGTPAREVGGGMAAYRKVTVEEKFAMMKDFVVEFLETAYPKMWARLGGGLYEVTKRRGAPFRILVRERLTQDDLGGGGTMIAITLSRPNRVPRNGRLSVFDVATKSYTKRLTEPEVEFMKFLLDARARFVPSAPAEVRLPQEEKETLASRG